MATAIATHPRVRAKSVIAIGTHRVVDMPTDLEWHETSHPIPDTRSVAAGERALAVASGVKPDECLVLLLSGGASALMAAPLEGVSLDAKQHIIHRMLLGGADIHALNAVRKHLSRIKGGRLAAACRGTTVTLAISDVVGDDLSVIGSGPGVADDSTVDDAMRALQQYAPDAAIPVLPETPKRGDARLARAHAFVIASRPHAVAAARAAAQALGYRVAVLSAEITGEARTAAQQWFARATTAIDSAGAPTCVLSAGETTVHVTGRGRGGRNQEFALSLVDAVALARNETIVASIGTDGIDGPTDAAGALVDHTTRERAAALDLDAHAFLAHNNAYEFFANLGDLIHLGRTETNVGDVQVLLRTTTTRR
jgi:glycerate 2-kinase